MTGKETAYLINAFKGPLLGLAKELKNEASHFINDGLEDYLNNIRGKFSRTKTFLYRNENVDFYSVFFPVSLNLGHTKVKIQSLTELFQHSRFATIIGHAGSGKTMLMKHFFLSSIDTQFRIPIVVELRSLNEFEGSIIEYIYQIIFHNKLSPSQRILERLLSGGNFIFLLDGYDEIFSNKKGKITDDLERFIDKYHLNNFLITSRPGAGIESFPRFNNYYVAPLSREEIIEFVDLQLTGNEDTQLADKIKTLINRPDNRDYDNFLSSPLLLSMFLLTFSSYPELPRRKSKFYYNVFDTLATKHDSFTKKGGYQHERKTGLQNEEFENILKWFSYISLFEGKYSFDSQYLTSKLNDIKKSFNLTYNTNDLIKDLTLSIAIIIVDGVEYKFPHKSLQEYFCALLIKDLPLSHKEKIYSEKLDQQLKQTNGGNENFWNLCAELDKINFESYFLVKKLEELYEELCLKSPISLTRYFYEITHLDERFSFQDNKLGFHSFGWRPNPVTQLLDYCRIYVSRNLALSNCYMHNPQKTTDYLLKNFTMVMPNEVLENGFFISYIDQWSSDFEILITELGIVERVSNLLESINQKIELMKIEIANDNKSTINLLDLK